MSQEKIHLSKSGTLAVVAGLISSVSTAIPASAAVHEIPNKIAILRSVSKASTIGSILSRAVDQRDHLSKVITKVDYSQHYSQIYTSIYIESLPPEKGEE